MHGRGFRQMVVHDDPNSVAFCHLDRRTRHTSIEAPNVECLAGSNFSADGFGYWVKHLGPVNHLPRELWHIGSFDHQRCAASLTGPCRMSSVLHFIVLSRRSFCGCQCPRAQCGYLLQETASVAHKSWLSLL